MKLKILAAAALLSVLISASASAETCIGPAPCDYVPPDATLCLGGSVGCLPVIYEHADDQNISGAWFAVASTVLKGYPVTGTAGPCFPAQDCPALYSEAMRDLALNVLRTARVMRFTQ